MQLRVLFLVSEDVGDDVRIIHARRAYAAQRAAYAKRKP
jgi:hypothetical protein